MENFNIAIQHIKRVKWFWLLFMLIPLIIYILTFFMNKNFDEVEILVFFALVGGLNFALRFDMNFHQPKKGYDIRLYIGMGFEKSHIIKNAVAIFYFNLIPFILTATILLSVFKFNSESIILTLSNFILIFLNISLVFTCIKVGGIGNWLKKYALQKQKMSYHQNFIYNLGGFVFVMILLTTLGLVFIKVKSILFIFLPSSDYVDLTLLISGFVILCALNILKFKKTNEIWGVEKKQYFNFNKWFYLLYGGTSYSVISFIGFIIVFGIWGR